MASGRGNSFYAFTILGILLIVSHLQKRPKHGCAVSGFVRAAGSSGTAALPALFLLGLLALNQSWVGVHGEAPCP